MDPFAIHSELTALLKRNLSASKISRISEFMYKNYHYFEELFNVVLEELNELSPVKRLNLFFLVDCLLKDCKRFRFDGYTKLIINHARDVIDLTLDITRVDNKAKVGAPMNAFAVLKALEYWANQKVIDDQKLEKIKALLNAKMAKVTLNKEQIWRRMEEDRDRQKKAREDRWSQLLVQGTENGEFLYAWTRAKPLTQSDLATFENLSLKYQLC